MSFQDFGRNNSRRATTNASLSSGAASRPASSAPSSSSGWGGSGKTSVTQISEELLQYQRNVGILEKIAQQLLTTTSSTQKSQREELEQQYNVQLDVLRQLEQKVKNLILAQRKQSNNNSNAQTLLKLERDFERVQGLAQSAKAKVGRQQKQLQQRNNNLTPAMEENAAANALQLEQERFQLQIQQDKLHEDIMREREEEIRNINKGMHTVNEIYKDLAHIVGSQQDQVDQIETQMEDARNNAESGLEQVQKANDRYNDSNCTIS
mmetsp:Transcript_96642/g.278998  ORF Transcript_96642/g.278998 Transcript_96642/m.278998 type:complete len:265 (-) Transcript_96642:193-987(-)|eukprot:CAMPEP_0176018332 /NCGR_PEP_ID=MMETSP0120_2-20121206/8824_1 /TAXON_ID=160619 /ORGANISM="Kryptoperidinium foliaceum, Strain CCMP 1326" /LENGTH=264 /DNA_ID=CAMNT_0017351381 /DNA_START=188 /DNA_END=982 /DNA_ORIENTATION=+